MGIDLAWSARNPSGLALLRLNRKTARLELLQTCCLKDDEEIVQWVEAHRRRVTVLGIDAPIIAPNPPGTARPCDRMVTREFGRFEAGAFPANSAKCAFPIALCKKVERHGFSPEPASTPKRLGCWQWEVYPHPWQVFLFNLRKTLKYKRGKVRQRRAELRKLGTHLSRDLSHKTPSLVPNQKLRALCTIGEDIRGKELKSREDELDAVVCAYIAAYYWWWGGIRCRVLGDVRRGYIVTPALE